MAEVFKCDACGEIGGFQAASVMYFDKDGNESAGTDDVCVKCRREIAKFLSGLVRKKKS